MTTKGRDVALKLGWRPDKDQELHPEFVRRGDCGYCDTGNPIINLTVWVGKTHQTSEYYDGSCDYCVDYYGLSLDPRKGY